MKIDASVIIRVFANTYNMPNFLIIYITGKFDVVEYFYFLEL